MKAVSLYILAAIVNFAANIVIHNNATLAILNSIFVSSSLFLLTTKDILNFTISYKIFIILLATIPLYLFPYSLPIYSLSLLNLVFIAMLQKKFNIAVLLASVSVVLIGSVINSQAIDSANFNIHRSLLVLSNNYFESTANMQNEAIYLPYRLRFIIFNNYHFLYLMLSRMVSVLSMYNLYSALLIANLYPLVLGVYKTIVENLRLTVPFLINILTISVIYAVSRHQDFFSSLLLVSPFILYFILVGMKYVSVKYYAILLAASYLVYTSPVI